MTVSMNNTSSTTIETHQPNNQPHNHGLPMTYLDERWQTELILSVLRFFTMLSVISDLWWRLLPWALFLQLNDIYISSILRQNYWRPIWIVLDELSLIQDKDGRHLGETMINRSVSVTILRGGGLGRDKLTKWTPIQADTPRKKCALARAMKQYKEN
jgi:hypothetical protein